MTSDSHHYLLKMSEDQWKALSCISNQLDMRVSEYLRHLLRFSSREVVINEMLPHMSGQVSFKLEGKKQ